MLQLALCLSALWTWDVMVFLGYFCALNFNQAPCAHLQCLGNGADVHGVDQAEAEVSVQVDATIFVHQAFTQLRRPSGVGCDAQIGFEPPYPRCGLQLDIHSLGSVLKVPTASRIGFVIALNEIDQFVVGEQRAFGTWPTTLKVALGLRGFVAHEPLAALIEAQPTVAVGYVGPFAHGLLDDVIHLQLSVITKLRQREAFRPNSLAWDRSQNLHVRHALAATAQLAD